MKSNSLTTGSVLGSLIKFAIPVLAAMFLQSLYGGVDLLVVGQFAETADVSGVSTGSILLQTITMVITGLTMGVTVFIGQKIGEGKKEDAGKAVGVGIVLFFIIGAVISLVLIFGNKALTSLLHAPKEAINQTSEYILVCGIGSIFIVFYNLIGAIFRGIGDSKTPLITVCIACVCNIVGDLLFVAVFHMGAKGAAIATVISQAISVVMSLVMIRNKELPFQFSKHFIKFDKQYIGRELKLGMPIALQELLVGISFIVIQTLVNDFGVNESAGVGVAEKVCGFLMLVPSAFSQSISAFVAQNIGAGEKQRALKSLKYGIVTSLCVAVIIGSFTFIRGDLLAAIFSKETLVIIQAHEYLKAYAIDVLLTSIMFCFVGYYNGCGHTLFVMIQGLIGALCVRIPIVYFMSNLSGTTLFHIGLGNPIATVVQIILCVGFMMRISKKKAM